MDNSNVLDKCSPVVPRIGRRNNNYDIRITRKNTNKTKQKENTSQQTKNEKRELVNPFAIFKAPSLLLAEERGLDVSRSKVLCGIWQMKFS